MRAFRMLLLLGLLAGCGRAWYHRDADAETYPLIQNRTDSPAVRLGRTDLTPPLMSRLADPSNPDRPPQPPDDMDAHRFMVRPSGLPGYGKWDRDGVADSVEPPGWEQSLNLAPDGRLKLDADRAVELSLRNSREYQTALEEIYLSALALTLNRFEFACRWFAGNTIAYSHFGSGSEPLESNTLTSTTRLGFAKNFAAGGQMLVDFANQYVFEFTGRDRVTMSSNLLITFLGRAEGRGVQQATNDGPLRVASG